MRVPCVRECNGMLVNLLYFSIDGLLFCPVNVSFKCKGTFFFSCLPDQARCDAHVVEGKRRLRDT